MTASKEIPLEAGREVRDRCLCFHTQRAARRLARRFDNAFLPFGITNQQFSLMMMVNTADRPQIGQVADFLAMDRTTLTAALKSLQRRGLIAVTRGDEDRRAKHLSLTAAGVKILKAALPVWRTEHALLETELPARDVNTFRATLRMMA